MDYSTQRVIDMYTRRRATNTNTDDDDDDDDDDEDDDDDDGGSSRGGIGISCQTYNEVFGACWVNEIHFPRSSIVTGRSKSDELKAVFQARAQLQYLFSVSAATTHHACNHAVNSGACSYAQMYRY